MTKLTTRESTSTRLTDTQLIVLSRAAQRELHSAPSTQGRNYSPPESRVGQWSWTRRDNSLRCHAGMPKVEVVPSSRMFASSAGFSSRLLVLLRQRF